MTSCGANRHDVQRVDDLLQHIAPGLASARAGKLEDGENVMSRLRARLEKG